MTTITIDRATVEQALEALELGHDTAKAEADRYHVAMAGFRPERHAQMDAEVQQIAAAITALRAALAQQAEPVASRGWLFRRNADGTIGIFAPPPKPGESQRTSDCVGPNNRDLHELLGKLADHMAALAQQAEPATVSERERCAEYLMQQAAECRENSPTRVTLESCAAVLRLGLHAQAEPVEPVAWLRVIDEAMVTHHLGVADPGDDYETAKRKMNNLLCMAQDIGTYFAKQAEPVEPVAKCIDDICSEHFGRVEAFDYLPRDTLLYTTPPQRKPLTDEEAAALIELDPRMLKEFGTAPSGAAMELIRRTERAHGIGGQNANANF